jgi:ABC-type multidrug transport system fused ATPase/permease subunit
MRILDTIGKRFTGRSDLSDQYQRYRETLLWIVVELFRFDRKTALLSGIFNVFGGLLKAGALALLLYYASMMERATPIDLLGFSLSPRSESVFYIAIAVALLLLVCGALAVYHGNHLINVLAMRFAAHYSRKLLCASGGRPAQNPNPSREKFHPSVKYGVTNITLLTRGVKPVLQVSNPLTTLIYSVVILFYLNAGVTLLVLLAALISLLFQYKVNFRSVQNEKALLESRRAGNKWLSGLFADLVLTPRIYPSRAAWIDHQYRHSALNDYLQRYYQRIIAQPRSALVGDLLLAALLFLVVGYMGSQALADEIGWTRFLAYLLFARISLLAFRGLLVSMTGFARYYPHVRRVFEFCRSLKAPACMDAAPLVVVARGKDKIGDRKRIKVNPGEPVCIISSVPLTRFNLYAFVDVIAGRNIEENNLLCAGTACISRGLSAMPGGSMNELMAIPGDASPDAVAARYSLIGLEYRPGMTDGDRLLSDAAWETFSRQTRACILLEQAKDANARLVLADAALLAKCGAAYLQQWTEAVSGKWIGIVSDDVHLAREVDCAFVLLMASDRSVSVATARWCLDNVAIIEAWFDRHSVQDDATLDEEIFEDE